MQGNRLLICIGMVAALATACGGSGSNKNPDGGSFPAQCAAGSKSCLDDHVALVCTSDGAALIGVQCGSDEICTAGACAANANVSCTADQNTCVDYATAMQCSSSGKGFNVVPCPTGTTCANGLCLGQVIVGNSACTQDYTGVQVSTDGFTYTTTPCPTGQYCVSTGESLVLNPYSIYQTAFCAPAECTPSIRGGCFGDNTVCGNPDDATASATDTLSVCTSTKTGWKWTASPCGAGKTCTPVAGHCGGTYYAGCTGSITCTPGYTECYGNSVATCNASGQVDTKAATSCATSANPGFTCIPTDQNAVCGDPACSDGNPGVCDPSGKYHACNNDFTVNATATACASGLCLTQGNGLTDPQGNVEGGCAAQCQDGDQRCLNSGDSATYEVCANGVWGAVQLCATTGGATCLDTTTSAGRPAIYCGTCVPGKTRCHGTAVQTCITDGTWGADVTCTLGTCQYDATGAVCRAQCIPGSKVCGGTELQDPTSGMFARSGVQTCNSSGLLDTAMDCAATTSGATTYCRVGPSTNGSSSDNPYTPNGAVLGCVVCVGGTSKNVYGLADTRCVDSTGTTNKVGTGGYTETCQADNMGWDTSTLSQCTGTDDYCNPADLASDFGASPYPAYCSDGE